MGMVVRTNTMSVNAYRQLGMNSNAVSKSLEKLSSGFRINRAGDDASGLAISEKMKAQINGLEQAAANAQDGISLIQTAEGATTEIHNMLNRMITLATKSANGTIQNEVDRKSIQTEVDALKTEITRIAKSTNFNGINLLDGSLTKVSGVQVGATDAVDAVFADAAGALADTGNVAAVDRAGTEAVKSHKEFAVFDVTANNSTDGTITISYTDDLGNSDKTLKITVADGATLTTSGLAAAISSGADDGESDSKFADLFDVTVDGNRLSITAKAGGAGVSVDSIDLTNLADGTGVNGVAFNTITSETIDGVNASVSNATLGKQKVTFSAGTDIVSGSTVTIGSKTFEFLKDGATVTDGNVGITLAGAETAAEISELIATNAASINGGTGFDLTVNGNNLVVSNTVAQGMDSLANSMLTGDRNVTTAVTFGQVTESAAEDATADITFSDTVTNNMLITVGDKTFQLTYDDDPTLTKGATAVELKKTDKAADIAEKLAAKITGATTDGAKFSVADGTAIAMVGQGLTLQVGDTNAEFNHVTVNVDDLTAIGLGIDALDVKTQTAAGDAIQTIKDAINKVSTNRGNLGALQNRLEYTINNLDATNENMQAANSRIRDTDMAKEMMNYTKMNILTQAAQAMLAQANQQPQSILQLLQ